MTKYKSIRKIVQFVKSFKSFKSFKLFKLFKLFKSCLRRIHSLLVSEVLPVDNVSIGSRCIGCGSSVFSLDLLDSVAWTTNLRAGLHSLRFGTCCVISYLICLYHVWNQSTGASCSTSNGKKNERGKRSRRYHSFRLSSPEYVRK